MSITGTAGGLTELNVDEVSELRDVQITAPTNGQTLVFQNNVWVNASAAGGGSGTVTSVSAGGGLTASTNPITDTGDISIANTAVSAGSYTLASITVNSRGQITAASNGAAGSGTVTSAGITGTDGIGVAGSPITDEGQFTLSLGNITPDNVTTGVVSATTLNVTGDVQAATGRITASAATISALLTGAAATFSGIVSANAGLATTTGSFSGLLTGATATFSGMVSANAGISSTTGNFSGLITGATATFSGLVSANAGLRATTVSASGVIGGSNLSGSNTGDVTLAGQNYLAISGQAISAGRITNAHLANMNAFTIKSNIQSSAAAATDNTLSTIIDTAVSGAAHGDILYRGNGTWTKLTAGTSGQYLMTQGVSASPVWGTVAGTGTVTSVSAGDGLTASPNPITAAGAIQLNTSAQHSWTQQQGFALATLTDASAVAWDVRNQQVAQLVIAGTGTRTVQDPTGMANGHTYILIVVKGSTGSGTLAFTSAYRWAGGTPPTLTATSGASDVFSFVSIGSAMYGSYVQNYSPN